MASQPLEEEEEEEKEGGGRGGEESLCILPYILSKQLVLLQLLPSHSFPSLCQAGSGQDFVSSKAIGLINLLITGSPYTEFILIAGAALVSLVFQISCSYFLLRQLCQRLSVRFLASLGIPVFGTLADPLLAYSGRRRPALRTCGAGSHHAGAAFTVGWPLIFPASSAESDSTSLAISHRIWQYGRENYIIIRVNPSIDQHDDFGGNKLLARTRFTPSTSGKIFLFLFALKVILVFVLSIGSLIIYFINSSDPVGSCSSYQDKTIPIDLTFNAFFSFYFGLRFLAADDKVKFWLEMNSIVDIFTIPPTFISYYLKSNWLGLRFLRALRLLELPQILQILQATKTSNSVKFSKLLSIVLSTWFTAAGFIHLVENSGDPWLKGRNSQNISYFESIYLVMATMSTVGFGDVVAKTSLGRTFIIFFTLGSLVLFANYIPEMVELFANKRKYTSSYEVVKGKKFIVVCGNITVDSVTAFLRNFLRHRSGEINTEIVFLGEVPPSLELETIFKCYMAYTTFVSGSALKWEDLRRVAVESAEACLIIANPLCSDLHAEDTSNIMRVLSIKNYYPQTRVIIQILQSHNKVFLPKIPSWNWSTGDNIICFAELKLGFIAQGCLVPGLCTFLTSLFVEQNKKVCPRQPWQKYFLSGLKNKILTQRLSDDFAGMSFPEVSRLCFVKMHLMLIAIQHKPTIHGYCGLVLNPPAQVKLRKNTLGFFIAESAKEVRRAFFYCATCHSDVYTPELIGKCSCKHKSHQHNAGTALHIRLSSAQLLGA
ncbi:hypothetical protein HPG69_009397 [Diceros bicornis minor]|uniref:RCK N-terminal domain-containing protein n=1 Tax=Diceros bicornis minor TaxID=77932 RepID=A0A7J7F315_DICBM|nr:hypothetical protein HPG69_009397 [Diceros bicornis minor]